MDNNYINFDATFCIFINFAKIQIFQRNFIIYFPFTLKKRTTMPKMKSVRGAVKRFKAGKNKIKRGSAFRSHILTKMSQKRKRNLREAQYVDSTNVSAVKKMLCK